MVSKMLNRELDEAVRGVLGNTDSVVAPALLLQKAMGMNKSVALA